MLPVSTFLWVKSVAGLPCRCGCFLASSFTSATPSPAWTQAGILRKQSHPDQPGIHSFHSGMRICIYEGRPERRGEQILRSLVCLIHSVHGLFSNCSSAVVKLRPNHKECKRQHFRNSKLIFRHGLWEHLHSVALIPIKILMVRLLGFPAYLRQSGLPKEPLQFLGIWSTGPTETLPSCMVIMSMCLRDSIQEV